MRERKKEVERRRELAMTGTFISRIVSVKIIEKLYINISKSDKSGNNKLRREKADNLLE